MSLKVVILESAEYDLKELRNYIVKNFSLETCLKSYGKIKKAIRNLKTFPYAGSIPEELEKLSLSQYRQLLRDESYHLLSATGHYLHPCHCRCTTRYEYATYKTTSTNHLAGCIAIIS